jgi:hypothetical protein
MTEEQKADEEARWAAEARAAMDPKKHTKGSHHYPSPSGPSSVVNEVPPLGRKPSFKKLHE